MLGHRLCRQMGSRHETWATYREDPRPWLAYGYVDAMRAIGSVDVTHFDAVEHALDVADPDVVINAVGIVKQRDEAKLAVPSVLVNALLPHKLAETCVERDMRLIHMSTDCVFSGQRGRYSEADVPDPLDLYGRSKLLGEVDREGCLTLRTSIIGWEVMAQSSLLEWFASQRGKRVTGFTRAIFSGLSTIDMADAIGLIVEDWPQLSGLCQVAAEPIDKYTLLVGLRDALGWTDIEIEPDDSFVCDRSLSPDRLKKATGWQAPSWQSMLARLAEAWPEYEAWRRQ
jgi:dTDP-4-dehydrorhamnose reductase